VAADWVERHLDAWLEGHARGDDREDLRRRMLEAVDKDPQLQERGWSGVRDVVVEAALEAIANAAMVGDHVIYYGVRGRQVGCRVIEVIGEPVYGRIGGLVRVQVLSRKVAGYSQGEIVQMTPLNVKHVSMVGAVRRKA
jgi:hypothetical protein